MTDPLSDYGEFANLAPLLVLKQRLEEAAIVMFDESNLMWVLPPSLLAGVTEAYGIPIVRADVTEPMLAIRQSWADRS
jgi:hypothetical protein